MAKINWPALPAWIAYDKTKGKYVLKEVKE